MSKTSKTYCCIPFTGSWFQSFGNLPGIHCRDLKSLCWKSASYPCLYLSLPFSSLYILYFHLFVHVFCFGAIWSKIPQILHMHIKQGRLRRVKEKITFESCRYFFFNSLLCSPSLRYKIWLWSRRMWCLHCDDIHIWSSCQADTVSSRWCMEVVIQCF